MYLTDCRDQIGLRTSSAWSVPLRDFQFYIADDRYAVPSLRIVEAESVGRAKQLAQVVFAESLHHRGVDVYADGKFVCSVGKPPASPPSTRKHPRPEAKDEG